MALFIFPFLFSMNTYRANAFAITPTAVLPTPIPDESWTLKVARRQTTSFTTVCGYWEGWQFWGGWADHGTTADPGYNCRQDTIRHLWGICPATEADIVHCSFAGYCIDDAGCSTGCGTANGMVTTSCSGPLPYCSTDLLISSQTTFTHITCAPSAGLETYVPFATRAAVASLSSQATSTTSLNQGSIITMSASLASSKSQISKSSDFSGSSSPSTPTPTSTLKSISTSTSTPISTSVSPPNNTGAIIGGVIGGLALISLTILILSMLKRYRPSTFTSDLKPKTTSICDLPELEGPVASVANVDGVHELHDTREDFRELDLDVPGLAWSRNERLRPVAALGERNHIVELAA